jgi:hypothetical protein
MSEPMGARAGRSLHRVTVVVELSEPASEGLPAAVLDAVPTDVVPAMEDPAAREGAITTSADGTALDLVLLVEGTTPDVAERTGLRAAEAAVRGAGLGEDAARLGQTRVEDAYSPGSPAAG